MARPKHWTPKTILAAVQAFVAQHGRLPQKHEWGTAHGLPGSHLAWKYFPSQAQLRLCLGLQPEPERPARVRRASPRSSLGRRRTFRLCLRCDQPIASLGPHHRLCGPCRAANGIEA